MAKSRRKRTDGRRTEKTVVAYLRVSSREQAEGYSIDAQRRKCRELIEKEGLTLACEPFIEVHSAATKGKRPVFAAMIEFLRKNPSVGGIVAHKIDRLMRNLGDLSVLFEDLEVRPWLVDQDFPDNAQGRLAYNMLGVFAKYYSDNLREEVKKGQLEKARQGGTPFTAPHGYLQEKGNTPTINREREEGLRRIFEDAASGRYTLEGICERAYERGYRYSKTRTHLYPQQLHRILRNPYYKGTIRFRGEDYVGLHDSLISAGLFDRVQRALDRTPNGYGQSNIPYRGMIFCGNCGRTVTGERKVKKTKSGAREYYYYRCSRYTKCGGKRVNLKALDEAMGEVVLQIRIPADHLEWIREALLYTKREEREYREREIAKLEKRLQQAREKADTAYMDHIGGKIDAELFQRVRKVLKADETQAKIALDNHSRASEASTDLGVRVLELAQRAYSLWLRQDHEEREKLVSILCLNLTLDGVSLVPTWRKPFDLLAKRLPYPLTSGWLDSYRTALVTFDASVLGVAA